MDRSGRGVEDAFLTAGDNDAPLHREFLGHFHEGLRLTAFGIAARAECQTGLNGKTFAWNIEVDLDVPFVEENDVV